MKNQDLLLFLLLAIFGFLIWNRTNGETFVDVSADKPVEPATIQTIINAIQAKVPDLYPIQTVYINPFEGDQGSMIYNARIMFLNTRGYFGVQYDVKALEMTEQPTPDMTGPFMAYTGDGYEKFEDIQTVLDQQFADLKTQVPGYETKLDTFLETQSSYNRARATQAARAPYEKIAATTGGSGYLGSGALAYSE